MPVFQRKCCTDPVQTGKLHEQVPDKREQFKDRTQQRYSRDPLSQLKHSDEFLGVLKKVNSLYSSPDELIVLVFWWGGIAQDWSSASNLRNKIVLQDLSNLLIASCSRREKAIVSKGQWSYRVYNVLVMETGSTKLATAESLCIYQHTCISWSIRSMKPKQEAQS